MSKLLNKILECKDIRQSISEAVAELEVDADLETEGKELKDLLERVTGYSFDYDFEFGEVVCFCVDNFPIPVNVVKRPDGKYDLFFGDEIVATKTTEQEIAKETKEQMEKAEFEEE